MIFFQKEREDRPVFTGFVNAITQRERNDKHWDVYTLGTREKRKDDTFIYSSWFCELGAKAREKCAMEPIEKGDKLKVYSMKLSNVSSKKPDGQYGKPYLRVVILDYDLEKASSSGGGKKSDGEITEEDLAY